MREPLLVASDLDGTLLGPLAHLSERTRAAVAAVTAAGVPFVLATARPPRWTHPISDRLGLAGYAVTANGALIHHLGERRAARSWPLDPVLLADVASALAKAIPGCSFAVELSPEHAPEFPDGVFLTELEHPIGWPEPLLPGGSLAHAPLAEVLGRPAVKLLVQRAGVPSAELCLAAEAVLAGAVDITYSGAGAMIELSAPGVSKATGLRWVAERLGVNQAEVLAFGDMPNDLDMIKWAGHGVAMANAHPDLHSLADEVTATNAEDGVAQVLERWFA
ncbi:MULTISPECIES: HAD family hydrolase [unclassified Crossiella]|uniref:HAD family hydrolase n=1 Tax=unclassified Crossiella TaxID=2620835 RepID=UPI001FFFE7E8|nr:MULTISPECIES: HAD family hydrolase [unclassified Crossiella]MCK2240153.1 Cof-type HAD-IIB family hydrolase [Crossiella sp. S99.2]MCK2253395.1 Cof-type HAD-IIB family hydrolase [Crossiella sp. S99.1]